MYRDTRRVTFAKRKTIDGELVITKVYWGLQLKTPLVFALTREGFLDRVFKFLGVSAELRTGDEAFDRMAHLETNGPCCSSAAGFLFSTAGS